jgi:NTE family protein
MSERKKVGLALGGGGARGLAHIGVLKILEKYNIPIDYISGTSIGALIGALYSAEPNAKKLEKECLETNWNSLFDYTFPSEGLIKGEKIEKFLQEKLDKLNFNQLKIPLFITAFDIGNKQEIIFNKGEVAKAVRASISIPGIFVPVENNGRILVDGSITDLIPTKILKKEGADIIIAVNVDYVHEKKPTFKEEARFSSEKKKIPGVISTISKSLQVMEAEASKAELDLDKADLVLNLNLENISTLDFSKVKETIKKGQLAANRSIKKLQRLTNPHPLKTLLEELNPIQVIKEVGENIGGVTKNVKENLNNAANELKKIGRKNK